MPSPVSTLFGYLFRVQVRQRSGVSFLDARSWSCSSAKGEVAPIFGNEGACAAAAFPARARLYRRAPR